jgi:hypothetical protein
LPHAPQLLPSVFGFVQTPPHVSMPLVQVVAHTPPLHTWPAAQAVPQAPQFFGSLVVMTQDVVLPLLQSVSPDEHVDVQLPATQRWFAPHG